MPVWARNGRELFYARGHEADTRELVAHDVDPAGTISRSGRRLFSLAAIRAEAYSPVPGYDVTPDGKRFVFVQSVEDPPAPPHPSQIHIVLNWFQDILLANDDGFDAPGLRALIDAFQPVADVVVAAPATEQSGKGHGLTLRDPIFVGERRQADGNSWYAIDGPPATCVRLAIEALLPRRPDLVVSGINRGDNLGATVFHAGTLGAAREGAIVGIPAIAVSIRGDDPADYRAAAAYVRQLVGQLQERNALRPGVFLNVNVPAGERKGVMIARLSTKPRHDTFEKRTSPRGRVYYWPDFRQLDDDDEGTDVWAFVRGYITVTPMTLDVTDETAMGPLGEVTAKH